MIKVVLLTLLSWSGAGEADSLRMETINGQSFVIHQVAAKETLFGISKRYGATVASILEYNPKADVSLEVGRILKVPYTPKSKVITNGNLMHKVAPKETLFSISKLYDISLDEIKAWNNLSSNSLTVGQELIVKRGAAPAAKHSAIKPPATGSHTVAEKETLYSISRQYGVSVEDIKKWNGLAGNELHVGQMLTVSAVPVVASASVTKPVVEKREVAPVVKEEVKPEVVTEKTIKISETATGTDEVKEKGLAELIEGTAGDRKYLALYNGAKPGTIMKVRNENNNHEVFVRVTGPLPEGTGALTIIRISNSAYDRLGATEPKFGVEVTHYR